MYLDNMPHVFWIHDIRDILHRCEPSIHIIIYKIIHYYPLVRFHVNRERRWREPDICAVESWLDPFKDSFGEIAEWEEHHELILIVLYVLFIYQLGFFLVHTTPSLYIKKIPLIFEIILSHAFRICFWIIYASSIHRRHEHSDILIIQRRNPIPPVELHQHFCKHRIYQEHPSNPLTCIIYRDKPVFQIPYRKM